MAMHLEGTNPAGHSARVCAEQLRAEQSNFTRVVARMCDSSTEERFWRLAALGEEKVGRKLAQLPDQWVVVHDLALGREGANIDHLVIGPPGVFAVTTLYLTGTLTVHDRAILHDGRRTTFLSGARAEARHSRRVLDGLLRPDIAVTPIIAIVGKLPDIRTLPRDVEVIHLVQLRHWLTRHPGRALGPDDIRALAERATDPTAWVLPADAPEPVELVGKAAAFNTTVPTPGTTTSRRASWTPWPTRRTT